MREWCVFNVETRYARKLGHESLDRPSLDQALTALEQNAAIDAAELARCNERIQRELASRVSDVEAAIARGDRDGARTQLKAIDGRFGGLAASAITDLHARISATR